MGREDLKIQGGVMPSPMGMKAYNVWRMFQAEQAKRHPDKAEQIWVELIVILVKVRLAAKEWDGRAPLPYYRRGAIWETVADVDAEEVARILVDYEINLEDLK
jgi:hypothetical protein